MAETGLRLELPYPPSMNHYWRYVPGRRKPLISGEGRQFRTAVVQFYRQLKVKAIDGPVRVNIVAFRPDRRRRDIDNILKSLLDALDHAGAYEDDSQIWDLSVRWVLNEDGELAVWPGGQVIVAITEI